MRTLAETYLGADAAARVLDGAIVRGQPERVRAVLWYSDLEGFTRLADTAPGEELIGLLNDYAEAVVASVHGHGGQVLKFIGDGILAMFPLRDDHDPVRAGPSTPRRRRSPRSTALQRERGGRGPARRPTSISHCTSARCSTAISAAPTGSTSPWSGRR